MGKQKRSKNAENNIGTSIKRIKLENDGDLLEIDSNEVSRNFIEINKNKATKCHNDKLKMGMNRYVGMSYQKLKRIMTTDINCDLHIAIEKRHVTIGWHQLGEAFNAIKYILNSSLGQYRKSLSGIILAVGKIDIIDKPFCIADQPCMHIDLNVNCIVFRPKQGSSYKCMVTAIDKQVLISIFLGLSTPFLGFVPPLQTFPRLFFSPIYA
ncbi:unnamed protein product [Acanthocheilonema viteae]|uniref:Uncharacterized protein n=1 Tax=Acanthocheilonema viteae TaxID=6277 RepID=A0A498SA58_ACAVI|nr:unnamed protein product [Acanthocheilonema viteae]